MTMNNGQKVRTIRILKGFSQENLADMIGISRLAYGDLERGKHEISQERLLQIAAALGVSKDDIEEVEEKVSNFFEHCEIQNVSSINKGEQHFHSKDLAGLKDELEKVRLESKNKDYQIECLMAKLEKAEIEVKYWREKNDK